MPIEFRQCAEVDAHADGVGNDFRHFKNRLHELAVEADRQVGIQGVIASFATWRDKIQQDCTGVRQATHAGENVTLRNLHTRANSELASARNSLAPQIVRVQEEYNRWSKRFPELKNHLDEPRRGNVWFLVGTIMFLFAAESIMNSRFFKEVNEAGIFGGTLDAFAISAGNILIPLLMGFLSHSFFHHYDSRKKVVGQILVALVFVWTIAFNTLIWHHRGTLLSEANLDVKDLDNVLLFAIGSAAAAISFWKMWTFLDPYRKARKCWKQLTRQKDALRNSALNVLRGGVEQLQNCLGDATRIDSDMQNRLPSIRVDLQARHQLCIDQANVLIRQYHTIYCLNKVDPDPDCPIIDDGNVANYAIGVKSEHMKVVDEVQEFRENWRTELGELTKKINQLIEKILSLIEQFETQLRTIISDLEREARAA